MAASFRLPTLPTLPVVEALPRLLAALADNTRVVLEAPPGAGKTTVVPLALLAAEWRAPEQKILVLEPRQLAVRGAAARLAELLGEPVGQTVGYRVRLDSKVSRATRIEVVTEGILTRMIQDDPGLEDVACVVFDEFHERSLNADLGLALALDAQAVLRDDLRILIMSATLEAERLGAWLPAPVISSKGFLFPIETVYLDPRRAAALPNKPGERLAELVPRQVREALEKHEGDVLVFLPGVADLQRVARKLDDSLAGNIDLHQLHGELPLEAQDAALRPARAGRRKVILATSIAETSLTIEGVRVVVDGGFARVPRFVPRTGFTTLETVPVARAAADQRRGRAGRLAPGTCYRLWTEAEHHQLPAHRPPEIHTADLSGLTLELALWGAQEPGALRWIDAPPGPAVSQARELLLRLGAVIGQEVKRIGRHDGSGLATAPNNPSTLTPLTLLPSHPPTLKPTPHGRQLAKLGLPPRLGHLVVRGQELGHGPAAAALAALLAERDLLRWATPHDPRPTPPDLRLRLEALASGRAPLPGLALHHATLQRVRDVARHLQSRLPNAGKSTPASSSFHQSTNSSVGLLTALAYPDRIAQREADNRLRLVTGQRVELKLEDVDPQATYFAVAHLAGQAATPRATLAAPLSKEELETAFAEQITTTEEVRFEPATQRVTGKRLRRLGALILEEKIIGQPDAALVSRALLGYLQEAGLSKLNWTSGARQLQQRLEFVRHHFAPEPNSEDEPKWPDFSNETLLADLPNWLGPHLEGLKSLDQVQRLDLFEPLLARLPGGWNQRQELDRLAPAALEAPSGSEVTLDYADPTAPVLAVKLQELFGLTETPTVAGGRVPLLLHLLSPGGRPAQVTRDLRSFWEKGYFEVRKDLKGRYPKHPWPDKPMEHIPTKLTKRRLGQ
ncbi:ATP-dependent helicase HrpB [Hymenobacter sp. ASUV-10]|uniref:ATP-dependent helicase HrpB n=1 Tax=Hymenobacter aranciens TaxID=3063996 RepID=A0ABT9BDS2_9BACT|nr:ATP-dependent helicase HrpB [Hymenobacter sp. ASUV-10]MDO7874663.1 ATP-dependent helicase HrpB [Hymenobacter sp. ASUV-10]